MRRKMRQSLQGRRPYTHFPSYIHCVQEKTVTLFTLP